MYNYDKEYTEDYQVTVECTVGEVTACSATSFLEQSRRVEEETREAGEDSEDRNDDRGSKENKA